MTGRQVDRWGIPGDDETEVVRVSPSVVRIGQDVLAERQTVWLTEEEWARVGAAMGWVRDGLVKLR